MEKNKTVLEVLSRSLTMESTLMSLGYSMEYINYMDNNEADLRQIACHITESIECLYEYQEKTTECIEKLRKEIESNEALDDEAPDDVKFFDHEKIENAALDTDRARATIGCLISALNGQGADNTITKLTAMSCWQLRASLEAVYNILERTALVFYETSEMIEKQSKSSVVKGQA